jgi:uncharacterized protein DUF932
MNAFNRPALTEMDIFNRAPSVFAIQAHASRSERFKPIPTIEVIRGLGREGWGVTSAQQQVVRIADRKHFCKHMLRLRKLDRTDLAVGDNILEMILVNGNDGSAAYQLDAGIFRIACMNGMVVKSSDFGGVRVRHTGEAVQKVIDGSYEVLQSAERALTAPQDWSKIQLTDRERFAFAKGAAVERWGVDEATNNPLAPIGPDDILRARRSADTGRDLWSTFNVIQENVTQGGQAGRTATGRRHTTRQIRGIDQNMSVNRGLWQMAEYLSQHASLKQAA